MQKDRDLMPPQSSSEPRVNIDDLVFDDDLGLLDGEPFSGEVFAVYADGQIEFTGKYRDGLPEGQQERWYPNGQLLSRSIAVRGKGSSESWSWYPDGVARSYRRNSENGLPIHQAAWDVTGQGIDPAELGSLNSAEVLSALFDQAVALKGLRPSTVSSADQRHF